MKLAMSVVVTALVTAPKGSAMVAPLDASNLGLPNVPKAVAGAVE